MVYRQHGMDGNIGCVVLLLYLKLALSTHVCTVHPLYPTAAAPDLNIGCLRAHCHQVRCHLCQLLLVEAALGQGLFGRKAGLEDEASPERPCRCSEGQHLTVQVDEPQRVSHSILQPGCGACRSCWLKARQSALLVDIGTLRLSKCCCAASAATFDSSPPQNTVRPHNTTSRTHSHAKLGLGFRRQLVIAFPRVALGVLHQQLWRPQPKHPVLSLGAVIALPALPGDAHVPIVKRLLQGPAQWKRTMWCQVM